MRGIIVLVLAILTPRSSSTNFDGYLSNWKNSIIYQVYPRSFKDSNGDGIGDLRGITSKLEHIKDAGSDALYLSPIYSSPQKDFGYDVSNFTDISGEYGTLDDFDELLDRAKKLGLKVLLDFVPNHTSDEHEWFQKSIDRIPPYDEYYIWRDAKKGPNGERVPPNNWLSVFGGSAWEWNEKRQQYYYHAYVPGQPDLNFRNPKLRKEMENVLSFWMNRGVDGFRVDSANLLFEDAELRDEPKSGMNVPEDDYDYFRHIYVRDLNETYFVIESWRILLDNFASEYSTNDKLLILETWAPMSHAMGYYDVGADPFNFILLFNLTKDSTALDFKRIISTWLNAIPEGKVANWIVGNHDNHRVASRFGKNGNRADQMSMLAMMLPGIVMVYNGDEIGMVDRQFTWEETVDPFGCQAGPDRYHLKSRDPERTPFQWDGSMSAGFSDSFETWLPVHENYEILNLALQKQAEISHYKVFQDLAELKRSSPVLQNGETEIIVVTEDVLGIVRRLKGQKPITLLINFSDSPVEIDARSWLGIPQDVKVHIASVESGLEKGQSIDTSNLKLRGAASVILM